MANKPFRTRLDLDAIEARAGASREDVHALVTEVRRLTTARPVDDWHEDFGTALWWNVNEIGEPFVGSPLASDWPGDDQFTHWTPIANPTFLQGEVVG